MANSMGSLFIGVSGLKTSQNALNITANNLANVDTKGYVRQRVLQEDRHYLNLDPTTAVGPQQSGLGVGIADVIHARDIFLDKVYRTHNGRHGFYSSTYETISEVETLFGELEGTAFQDMLTGDEGLWAALEEFAKEPSDRINQNLVIEKANLFVSRAQAVYKGLQTYQNNLNQQISDKIDEINDLGETIRDLNMEIMKIEAGGVETAMDLRDLRDMAIDELSKYGAVTYKELGTGIVKVSFEHVSFVDEYHAYKIEKKVDKVTGFITPYWDHLSKPAEGSYYKVYDTSESISTARKNDIGELKALILARGDKPSNYLDIEGISMKDYDETVGNSVMMNIQSEFDLLVHSIVTGLNDLFAPNVYSTTDITGTDENGNAVTIARGTKILDTKNCCVGSDEKLPPQELFVRTGCPRYKTIHGDDGNTYYVYNEEDPKDTSMQYTTGGIRLNQKLLESESLLPFQTQNGRPGELPVAYELGAAIEALWKKEGMYLSPHDTTPCTFSEYYSKMTSELALLGDVFQATADGLEGTKLSTDNARQQVIGVSSDEELTAMVKYQSAYNASSRFMNVISEMIETIIHQMG